MRRASEIRVLMFCSRLKTFLFFKFYSQWHCILFTVFFVRLLWPPGVADADILSCSCSFFFFFLLFLSFFLAYSRRSQIGCLSYFHKRCGLSANLECRSELCCTRLAENTWRKNYAKKSPSAHYCTILLGCIFVTKAHIDNRKELFKQQYVFHISSQYGELRLTNGWDRLVSLGHPSKFQRVSRLGFVTAPTSLIGGRPNFARCLAVSWAGTLYIHFWGLLPPLKVICNGFSQNWWKSSF